MKSTVAAARLSELVHTHATLIRQDDDTGLPGVLVDVGVGRLDAWHLLLLRQASNATSIM